MQGKRLRPMTAELYADLIALPKGRAHADIYLQGGQVLNVYTGELLQANVAIKGAYIGYVGLSNAMVGPDTKVISVVDRVLVPGYIEPHAHPFQWYNAQSLASFALSRGTTTLVNDNLMLYLSQGEELFFQLINQMANWPIKMLWWARLDSQTVSDEEEPAFQQSIIDRMLRHPAIVQTGELTGWPSLLAGNPQIRDNIWQTQRIGKRVEGHLPGASDETVQALTAAGVTADHESMTGTDVLHRLRAGLYTTLRYSSLRPDLPSLVRDLQSYTGFWERVMMTMDGGSPYFLREGLTDSMLRVAMEHGVDPVLAYRSVTLNPAVYYGLDGEIGGIAPGRLADINVLESLSQPTPLQVLAEGAWVDLMHPLELLQPAIDWEYYGITPVHVAWRLRPEQLELHPGLPRIRLENPAITRLVESATAADSSDRPMYGAMLPLDGQTITEVRVDDMFDSVEGMASTFTAAEALVLLGSDPAAMTIAANRVLEMGGGVAIVEGGQIIYEMPLPLAGQMSELPLDELIPASEQFFELLRQRGHRHYDPIYTLLFLTSTHLPEVRFTIDGLLHVKSGKLIKTARTL